MDKDIKSTVYGKNVVEFVTVANEYCVFVENAADFEKSVFVDRALKILSLLYLKASMLPDLEVEEEEEVEKFVTEFDWQILKNGIASVLGDGDIFLDFFDQSMNETPEPVTCTISENLADIFQDLKDFLEIYKLGNEEVSLNALLICKNTFIDFWGFKLCNSLKTLHILKYTSASDSTSTQNKGVDRDTKSWFISKAQEDFQQDD